MTLLESMHFLPYHFYHISEITEDRHIVTMEDWYQITYRLLVETHFSDLEWPR